MPTSPEVDNLKAQVEAEDTVIDSVIVLLNGLAQQMTTVAGDKAAVTALASSVSAKAQALSDAVVANTPSA